MLCHCEGLLKLPFDQMWIEWDWIDGRHKMLCDTMSMNPSRIENLITIDQTKTVHSVHSLVATHRLFIRMQIFSICLCLSWLFLCKYQVKYEREEKQKSFNLPSSLASEVKINAWLIVMWCSSCVGAIYYYFFNVVFLCSLVSSVIYLFVCFLSCFLLISLPVPVRSLFFFCFYADWFFWR